MQEYKVKETLMDARIQEYTNTGIQGYRVRHSGILGYRNTGCRITGIQDTQSGIQKHSDIQRH